MKTYIVIKSKYDNIYEFTSLYTLFIKASDKKTACSIAKKTGFIGRFDNYLIKRVDNK